MPDALSPREREILELVANGRTSKEIAAALGIAESTVNWHVSNALAKLGASTRAGAIAVYLRERSGDRTEPLPVIPPRAVTPPRPSWHVALIGLASLLFLLAASTLYVAMTRAGSGAPVTPAPATVVTTSAPTRSAHLSSPPPQPTREDGAVDEQGASGANVTSVPPTAAPTLPPLPTMPRVSTSLPRLVPLPLQTPALPTLPLPTTALPTPTLPPLP